MLDTEPIKHGNIDDEASVEDKTVILEDDSTDTRRRNLVITAWVAGAVAVMLLFMAGFVVLKTVLGHRIASHYSDTQTSQLYRTQRVSPFGYGQYSRTEMHNNTVSTTVYTSFTGVVVEVHDGDIVVAGNGTRMTITTDSSTQYDNDIKPAINDTVTVTGTTSGNKTTATGITVIND